MNVHIGTKIITITNTTSERVPYLYLFGDEANDVYLKYLEEDEKIETKGMSLAHQGFFIFFAESFTVKIERRYITNITGFSL